MKLAFVCLLLSALQLHSALNTATGNRLVDYTNWFQPFAMASDSDSAEFPHPPVTPIPFEFDNPDRYWSGWVPNAGSTKLAAPATEWGPGPTFVDIVFLGESSAYLNDWGLSINGVDTTLADSIQAAGEAPTIAFGDHTIRWLMQGETIDFWFQFRPDRPAAAPNDPTVEPARYYVFNQDRNTPGSAALQSYHGNLVPLTMSLEFGWQPDSDGDFTVVAFEESMGENDRTYNDFIFAYHLWADAPCCGTVPEPSTYGLCGAGALLLAGAGRIRRKAGNR